MREYLVTLLIAAAICYVVTPYVRTWAIKFGVVAKIRERDIHTTPTPRNLFSCNILSSIGND